MALTLLFSDDPGDPTSAYSPHVTVCLLALRRLRGNASLEEAVAEAKRLGRSTPRGNSATTRSARNRSSGWWLIIWWSKREDWRADVAPRRLCFKGAWSLVQSLLLPND